MSDGKDETDNTACVDEFPSLPLPNINPSSEQHESTTPHNTTQYQSMTIFLKYNEQTKKYISKEPISCYTDLYHIFSNKYAELHNKSSTIQYYINDKQYNVYTIIESCTDEIYDGCIIDARINNTIDSKDVEAGEIVSTSNNHTGLSYVIDQYGDNKRPYTNKSSHSRSPIHSSRSRDRSASYRDRHGDHRSHSPSPYDKRYTTGSTSELSHRQRTPIKLGRDDSYAGNARDGRKLIDIRDELNTSSNTSISSRSSKYNDTATDSSHVVRLSGLPYTVKVHEICKFLYRVKIPDVARDINLQYRDGEFTGIAYVNVFSSDDVAQSLLLNNTMLGKQHIKVQKSTTQQRDRDIIKSNDNKQHATTPYIRAYGLPYSCTKNQIYRWLRNIQINNVYLCDKNGKGTGVGYIECSDIYNATKALKHDHEKLDWRYIELYPCDHVEVQQKIQQGIITSNNNTTVPHNSHSSNYNHSIPTTSTEQQCIRVYGLLPTHNHDDIKQFFQSNCGVLPTRVHRIPGGDTAYLEFNSNLDVYTAMKCHKKYIGKQYMELRTISYSEVMNIIGVNDQTNNTNSNSNTNNNNTISNSNNNAQPPQLLQLRQPQLLSMQPPIQPPYQTPHTYATPINIPMQPPYNAPQKLNNVSPQPFNNSVIPSPQYQAASQPQQPQLSYEQMLQYIQYVQQQQTQTALYPPPSSSSTAPFNAVYQLPQQPHNGINPYLPPSNSTTYQP